MSVRQSLLALLDQGPSYGYQLRAEFERRTGAVWPLNAGQIYSTLDRLERDGLVVRSEIDAEGQVFYEITPEGRTEVSRWLVTPAKKAGAARDELAIKLAIASTLPGIDIAEVVHVQRAATLSTLQELTHTKARTTSPESPEELAWLLVIESLIFAAEAEVRWLDHSEALLRKHAERGSVRELPLSSEPVRRGRPAGASL